MSNDYQKLWEAEIRADERNQIAKEVEGLRKAILEIDIKLSVISGMVNAPAKAPKKPAAARKTRKAVSATDDEMQTVLEALTELQREYVGRYFSIKELCGAVGIGAKTVGAALRSLEEGGVLVEKGRKYCLAAVEGESPSVSEQSNGAVLDADNPPF